MRLRLLPVLVLTASLALTVRVGDLWRDVDGVARAQTVEKPSEKAPASEASKPDASKSSMGDGTATTPAPMQTALAEDLPSDPLLMTDEEIDLLRALADRRKALDERASEIDDREILLEAAQRRIEEKVDGLEALKKSIEALLQEQENESETQYDSLVKIYESMKPKDAARIFEELQLAVLIPVIERMKERKTAPILAKMDPLKAKAVTVELAKRRDSPVDDLKAEQKPGQK
jgi:flagellar motility protein MotE (MotC chaperone)